MVVNKEGRPLCITTTSAKGHEREQALILLDHLNVISGKNKKQHVGTSEIADFFGITRKRWVVERTFSWLKRKCRRLLMRWERLASLWEAFSKLGLIYMWLGYLVG